MLNRVTIEGRIAKDIELRRTATGVAVTTIRIACDSDFKDKNGEKETYWFDVVAWRNTAEFISKNFSKGRLIIIDGILTSRSYKDKDGNNRVATEIKADNVYFGDSKSENKPTSSPAEFKEIEEDTDGDLPF